MKLVNRWTFAVYISHHISKQTFFEMQKFSAKTLSLVQIVYIYAISFSHIFVANFTVAAHYQTFIQDEMFGFLCARTNFMFNSYFVVSSHFSTGLFYRLSMQTQNLMQRCCWSARKQAVKEALALELNNFVFVIFGMFQCTIKHVYNCRHSYCESTFSTQTKHISAFFS